MSWLRKNNHKNEHRFVEDRLSAYLDGELQPRERQAIERHLAGCEPCRWNLETLRQTVRWTRGLKPVPAPRAFTIPVSTRAPRAARPVWGMPVLRAATVAVALLFVVALAGDYVLTGLAPRPANAPLAAVVQTVPVEEQAREGELQTMQEAAPEAAVESAPPAEEQRSMEKSMPADATVQDVPAQPPAAPAAEDTAHTYEAPLPTVEPAVGTQATPTPEALGMGGEVTPESGNAEVGGAAMVLTVTAVVEESIVAAEVATPTLSPPPGGIDSTALTAVVAMTMSTTTVRLTGTLVVTPTAIPMATYGTSSLPITPSPGVTLPPPTATPTEIPAPRPTPTAVPTAEPPVPPAPAGATLAPAPTQAPEPTVVAAAPQQPSDDEGRGSLEQDVQKLEEVATAATPWLRLAEVVLGGALAVLLAALIVVRLRRR